MKNASPGPTSLLLLALVLVTGIGLGWLLNDVLRAPAAAAPGPSAEPTLAPPTSTPEPPTSTLAPSATPVRATGTPAPSVTPLPPTATPVPTAPVVVGYAGYTVAEGETLAQIAADGGSAAALVADYNRLSRDPAPGRALIVPRLAGEVAALENQPLMVRRGAATRPWVAFTLDAGASAEPTGRMLDVLRERGVRITFFLTGKWIADNPELTRRIVAEGHELANHTYRHPDLTTLDDEAIRRELAETEAALDQVAPGATLRPFFRPPYGAYDERVQRVVQAEGYLPVYWTLDSLDSVGEPKTPKFLLKRVTGTLSAQELRGAIILAHCGSAATAEALPAILDRFAALGLEVRPVSEVLEG